MARADQLLQLRAAILADLDARWQPHSGQRLVRQARRINRCNLIFVQCGRKWGKTDWLLREAVEDCLLPQNEGETVYYMAYEDDQAKQIAWNERRPHKMCDPRLIKRSIETEMRIEYWNGRSLIIDGSNNYKKYEGVRPAAVYMDEFKRFRRQLWEVMEPNLSVYNAPAVFAGSPPDQPCQYTELAALVKEMMDTGESAFYIRQPSWMNDKIKGLVQWLFNRRKIYIARGDYHIFQREYEALYIQGGNRRIFPMYDRQRFGKSERWLKERIGQDARRWNWYVIADPATSSVFGVLFFAVHPETKEVLVVDGIYEKDRSRCGSSEIWIAIKEKMRKWYADFEDWGYFYDDHEDWFQLESQKVKDSPNWTPAGKHSRSKDVGVSTLKDLFLVPNRFFVNDGLADFHREFSNYATDEDGKIPKGNDHFVDIMRYLMVVSSYDLNLAEQQEIDPRILADPWLAHALRTDEVIESDDLNEDWTHGLFDNWAPGWFAEERASNEFMEDMLSDYRMAA